MSSTLPAEVPTVTTAEELAALPDDGRRYELIAGELRMMSPAGNEHGRVAALLTASLWNHVQTCQAGEVFAAETGFLIGRDPDTVRAPDAAFVSRERLHAVGPVSGYWPGAPDLAVEVVSPNDSYSELHAKALGWLAAGSRAVLVVDPAKQTVTVYRSSSPFAVLGDGQNVEVPEVLPGWSLPVHDIFQ